MPKATVTHGPGEAGGAESKASLALPWTSVLKTLRQVERDPGPPGARAGPGACPRKVPWQTRVWASWHFRETTGRLSRLPASWKLLPTPCFPDGDVAVQTSGPLQGHQPVKAEPVLPGAVGRGLHSEVRPMQEAGPVAQQQQQRELAECLLCAPAADVAGWRLGSSGVSWSCCRSPHDGWSVDWGQTP